MLSMATGMLWGTFIASWEQTLGRGWAGARACGQREREAAHGWWQRREEAGSGYVWICGVDSVQSMIEREAVLGF